MLCKAHSPLILTCSSSQLSFRAAGFWPLTTIYIFSLVRSVLKSQIDHGPIASASVDPWNKGEKLWVIIPSHWPVRFSFHARYTPLIWHSIPYNILRHHPSSAKIWDMRKRDHRFLIAQCCTFFLHTYLRVSAPKMCRMSRGTVHASHCISHCDQNPPVGWLPPAPEIHRLKLEPSKNKGGQPKVISQFWRPKQTTLHWDHLGFGSKLFTPISFVTQTNFIKRLPKMTIHGSWHRTKVWSHPPVALIFHVAVAVSSLWSGTTFRCRFAQPTWAKSRAAIGEKKLRHLDQSDPDIIGSFRSEMSSSWMLSLPVLPMFWSSMLCVPYHRAGLL